MTRDDWLDAALAVLRQSGHTGLRAEPMARRLGVTRGSFYWHFADVGAFHDAVLGRWSETATDDLIARTLVAPSPRAGLAELIARAFSVSPALERAVQAWALDDPRAAATVDAINRRRTAHLAVLFRQIGLSEREATARASLLYWAFLGRVQTPDLPGGDDRLRALEALMLTMHTNLADLPS